MALDQNHEQCNAVVKGKRGVTDLILKDEALRRWLIAQPIIVDLLKDFMLYNNFMLYNQMLYNNLEPENIASYSYQLA